MGDKNDRSTECFKCLFELFDCRQVEVVRWFVEDQAVGAVGHEQSQDSAGSLARRQGGSGAVHVIGGKVELCKQGAGLGNKQAGCLHENFEQCCIGEGAIVVTARQLVACLFKFTDDNTRAHPL